MFVRTQRNMKKTIHQGHFIRDHLEKEGLKQTYLAKKIRRAKSTVYNILEREVIDLELLEKISNALGINLIKEFYPNDPDINVQEGKVAYRRRSTSTNKTTMKLVIDIDPDDPAGISIDFISKLNDMLMDYNKGK